MLFNSLQFAIFFVIVFSLYVCLNHRWQNRLLLVASYIFYGAWDWRFLSLIFISTLLDFFCGLKIDEATDARKRKWFLALSMAGNLFILGFFKYANFFVSSLQPLLNFFGLSGDARFLHVVLPVGISFYTFQTMSYTIDIYRKEISPTRSFEDFALFVAFFPQLVAGPIERAKNLLPQILAPRSLNWEKFSEGAYLIFWGLFQKVFIADNLALIADEILKPRSYFHATDVLVGCYAFAFLIFCDFAGYSNIARGVGKCLGFDIMVNFHLPYFASNPQEFWRRWHISLSTWLRDYLYIPLGGNRGGAWKTFRNLMITMTLGGLWHGAAWTFVLWGVYQGLLLVSYRLLKPLLAKVPKLPHPFLEKLWKGVRIILFFHLVCLGWLIFRAESFEHLVRMGEGLLFHCEGLRYLKFQTFVYQKIGFQVPYLRFLLIVAPLILVQIFQSLKQDLMAVYKSPWWVRMLFYVAAFYLMSIFGVNNAQAFIYFQF